MIIEKKKLNMFNFIIFLNDHFFLCFEVDAIVYFGAEHVSFDFALYAKREEKKHKSIVEKRPLTLIIRQKEQEWVVKTSYVFYYFLCAQLMH